MDEVNRIINNCSRSPYWHGTCSRETVNKIMEGSGTVYCNGTLREFEFEMITPEMYKFKTVDWYNKRYG